MCNDKQNLLEEVTIDYFTIQTGLATLGLYKHDKENNVLHLKEENDFPEDDTLIKPKNRIIQKVNDWLKKHKNTLLQMLSPENFSKEKKQNREEYLNALLNGVYKKTIQLPDLDLKFETNDIYLDYLDFILLAGMEAWYNFYYSE